MERAPAAPLRHTEADVSRTAEALRGHHWWFVRREANHSNDDAGDQTTEEERLRRGDAPRQQERTARQRRQISAQVVHEAIRFEGEEELDRPTVALFWSGLAAGLTMGISLAARGLIRIAAPDAPWRTLAEAFGYTLGFVFVVAGRQQLFTENTLTPVLPVLNDRSRFPDLARLWSVVLVANLIGALGFAWFAAATPVFEPSAKAAFLSFARESIAPSAIVLFLRAIVAGWLIALMVWLLPAAEHSRLAMIVLTTYVIALGHLTHSIAGSVDVFYLVVVGETGWLDYGRFILCALAGNIVGGVVFVAILNHKQAMAGDSSGD
jgi:formate/nitrite transporter FocA (FNT family)